MTCKTESSHHIDYVQNYSEGDVAMPAEQQLDLMDYAAKRKEALARAEALREAKKHESEQRGQRVRKYSWGGIPTEFHSVDHTWTKPDEDPRVLLVEDTQPQQRSSRSPSGGRTPRQRRKPLLDTNMDAAALAAKSKEGDLSSREHSSSVSNQGPGSDPTARVRCLACHCRHSSSGACDTKATSSTQEHDVQLARMKSANQSVQEHGIWRHSTDTVSAPSGRYEAPSTSSFRYPTTIGTSRITDIVPAMPVSIVREHEAEDDAYSHIIKEVAPGKEKDSAMDDIHNTREDRRLSSSVPPPVLIVPVKTAVSAPPVPAAPSSPSSIRAGKAPTAVKKNRVVMVPSNSDVERWADQRGAAPEKDRLSKPSVVGGASDTVRSNSVGNQREAARKGGAAANLVDKRNRRHGGEMNPEGVGRGETTSVKSSGSLEHSKKGSGSDESSENGTSLMEKQPHEEMEKRAYEKMEGGREAEAGNMKDVSIKSEAKHMQQDRYAPALAVEAEGTDGDGLPGSRERGRERQRRPPREAAVRRHSSGGAGIGGHGSIKRVEDPYMVETVMQVLIPEEAQGMLAKKDAESEGGRRKWADDAKSRLLMNMEAGVEDGEVVPALPEPVVRADNAAKLHGKVEEGPPRRRTSIEPENHRGAGKHGPAVNPAAIGGGQRGKGVIEKPKAYHTAVEMKRGNDKPEAKGHAANDGINRKPHDKADIRRVPVATSLENEAAPLRTAKPKPEVKKLSEDEVEVDVYSIVPGLNANTKVVHKEVVAERRRQHNAVVDEHEVSEKVRPVMGGRPEKGDDRYGTERKEQRSEGNGKDRGTEKPKGESMAVDPYENNVDAKRETRREMKGDQVQEPKEDKKSRSERKRDNGSSRAGDAKGKKRTVVTRQAGNASSTVSQTSVETAPARVDAYGIQTKKVQETKQRGSDVDEIFKDANEGMAPSLGVEEGQGEEEETGGRRRREAVEAEEDEEELVLEKPEMLKCVDVQDGAKKSRATEVRPKSVTIERAGNRRVVAPKVPRVKQVPRARKPGLPQLTGTRARGAGVDPGTGSRTTSTSSSKAGDGSTVEARRRLLVPDSNGSSRDENRTKGDSKKARSAASSSAGVEPKLRHDHGDHDEEQDFEDGTYGGSEDLLPCKDCGRKFNVHALARHTKFCHWALTSGDSVSTPPVVPPEETVRGRPMPVLRTPLVARPR